jgi:hypothetical protein
MDCHPVLLISPDDCLLALVANITIENHRPVRICDQQAHR